LCIQYNPFESFFHSVAWVVVALLVARWTQFYSTLWSGSKPNRNLLAIAFLGVGINTVFMLYLVVYLPKWKKLSDSSAWSIYCPRVIPAMTGVGIATFLIFVRALWPVWGFLAPLIFGTQVMGLLFGLHFIPIPSV
jgi:hypothetical protein